MYRIWMGGIFDQFFDDKLSLLDSLIHQPFLSSCPSIVGYIGGQTVLILSLETSKDEGKY